MFLTGHIFYLAAILKAAKHRLLYLIAGVILTALLMMWIFKRISAATAFKIFGVVYIGAIVLLNCVAVGNLITDPSAFTGIFAAGAILFLVSDIVLILNTFGKETKQSLRVTKSRASGTCTSSTAATCPAGPTASTANSSASAARWR